MQRSNVLPLPPPPTLFSVVCRNLLRKYRSQKKIDKHLYQDLYQRAKGNTFKNKRVLIEYIHKAKAETIREDTLKAQAEAHRNRVRAAKERKERRKVLGIDVLGYWCLWFWCV